LTEGTVRGSFHFQKGCFCLHFVIFFREHQALSERLQYQDSTTMKQNHEREFVRAHEKMEMKGKQITMIRDVLKANPVLHSPRQPSNRAAKLRPQEIYVTNAIKGPKTSKQATDTRTININENLELLKKVKKLQYTLQKDDLKWD
jgi:hypothetical protein